MKAPRSKTALRRAYRALPTFAKSTLHAHSTPLRTGAPVGFAYRTNRVDFWVYAKAALETMQKSEKQK